MFLEQRQPLFYVARHVPGPARMVEYGFQSVADGRVVVYGQDPELPCVIHPLHRFP